MFSSGSDNGNPFEPPMGGPFMGGGFGDAPPEGGMFGDMEGDLDGGLFGLEPIDAARDREENGFLTVGLHFHGEMRGMKK